KIRGEKQPAPVVSAAEKMFRNRDHSGAECDPERDRDLLPERVSSHEKNRDGQKRNQGQENEAWLDRGEENRGSARADAQGNRRFLGDKGLRQKSSQEKKVERKQERTNAFRPDSHFGANWFAREEKGSGQKQSERRVGAIAKP